MNLQAEISSFRYRFFTQAASNSLNVVGNGGLFIYRSHAYPHVGLVQLQSLGHYEGHFSH